jgi:hypothetical protein
LRDAFDIREILGVLKLLAASVWVLHLQSGTIVSFAQFELIDRLGQTEQKRLRVSFSVKSYPENRFLEFDRSISLRLDSNSKYCSALGSG